MTRNGEILKREILKLSVSNIWNEALQEWRVEKAYRTKHRATCLCSHSPIIEVCLLKNHLNSNTAIVGNSCVKKFFGLSADKVFLSIKKLESNDENILPPEAIQIAFRAKWINEWENTFYSEISKKTHLSIKQIEKLSQINKNICSKFHMAQE